MWDKQIRIALFLARTSKQKHKMISCFRFCKVWYEHIRDTYFSSLHREQPWKSTNTARSSALFEPSSRWMISRNNVPVTLNHIKTWLTFNFSHLICKNFHLICSKGHWNSIIKRIKISGVICSERDIKSRKCWIFLLSEQWEMALSAGT